MSDNRAISYESVSNLITAVQAALDALNNAGGGGGGEGPGVWINENTPPTPVGGFLDTAPATPPEGLTFPQAMNKLLFPVIPPIITGAATGAEPTYKTPAPTFGYHYNVDLQTAGVDPALTVVVIEWKRASDPEYQATKLYEGAELSQNLTFTYPPELGANTSNDAFQIRVTATDNLGGTNSHVITRTMAAKVAPYLSLTPGGSNYPVAGPGNTATEKGGIDTLIPGLYVVNPTSTVTFDSANYQIYWRQNGVDSTPTQFVEGAAITINQGSGPGDFNPALNSLEGFVRVVDSEGTVYSYPFLKFFSATNLLNKQFYGVLNDATAHPTNSAEIRALPQSNFATVNTINVVFTEKKFVIAIPASKTLVSAISSSLENQPLTLEQINVTDAGGDNPILYKVYKYTSAEPLNLNVTITLA